MANTVEIIITGKNLTKPEFDRAVADARKAGKDIGAGLSGGAGEELKRDLPKDVEKPLEDSGRKGGQAAGKAAGGGISPLIVGAFAAAATVGPALVLAATATAVIGAGVLITKGNAQLQESYAQLGQRASAAIQDAAAPLIPQLYASVQVLEQGVARVGPELKSVFSAVAPDVTALTGGLVSLVANTLPGVASGLRAIAPYAQSIAIDFGKLGSGLGGFFQGLGTGASGGTTGLNALTDVLSALLTDIGKLVGSLSNGLGPALHDVANVAIPVANALTDVVDAMPPHVVEATALAVGLLFAAFKIGTLTNLVAEGTSFVGFLRATATTSAIATVEVEGTSVAMRGLAIAESAALGPLGLLAGAVTLFGLQSTFATGGLSGFTSKLQAAVDAQKQQKQAAQDATAAVAEQKAQTDATNNSLSTQQQLLVASAVNSGNAAITALSFAGSQNTLNGELSQTITDFNLAGGASSAYKTALDALYGKYQSYSDAQATFTTDLDNARKGLLKGKDGFDVNTDAGAKNYQLMSQLATANENRAEALLKETDSQDQANRALQAGAVQIDNMARQAGFTKKQIDDLNIALYGTKNIGSIKVPISADTSGAYAQLHRLVYDINNTAAYVQVGASGTSVGGHQLFAHGGVRGAASGGPRGGRTVVGEHGIELVDLPPGTTVHSNPDSQRMLAQGGVGAEVHVVLEWAGSSSDPIFQMLREGIRVRGGNASNSVQVVLGQNF